MLNYRPFEKSDVIQIPLDYELDGESRVAMVSHKDIVGYTLLWNDEVIAVGGVHMMWFGVGEGWLLVSPEAMKRPIALARYTKRLLHDIMSETQVRRVQASVHVDDNRAYLFAEWLGFENEGIMRKFGVEGDDYTRLARVKE